MPAGGGSSQNIYIGQGTSIESMNVDPNNTYSRPGEIGQRVYGTTGKKYQLVIMDSGATAATPAGAPARGQLLFYRAKGAAQGNIVPYTVTNDIRVALGAQDATKDTKRNNVAGVCMVAATPGYMTSMQTEGNMSAVYSDGGGDWVIGDFVIAGDNTSAQADRVAAGTAPGWTVVGLAAGVEASNLLSVDLSLPDVP